MPTPEAPAPWSSVRGDHRGSGRQRVTVTPAPWPVRRWEVEGGLAGPVIGPGERVLAGGSAGVHTWHASSGEVGWTAAHDSDIVRSGALDADGTLYMGDRHGSLVALSDQGELRWRFDPGADQAVVTPSTSRAWRAPVVVGPDGHLYAGNDDFHVYSVTPSGRLRWATSTGLFVRGPCAFGADGTVLAGSFDAHLVALSPESGEIRWRRDLHNVIAAGPAVSPDGTATLGTFAGRVVSVDVATGEIHWRRDIGAPIEACAALLDDGLVVGALDGRLTCLDPSGQIRWSRSLGSPIHSSPVVYDDEGDQTIVLVATRGGRLHALAADGSTRWTFDTLHDRPDSRRGGVTSSIAVGRHGIATADRSGNLWYLPADGARRGLPGFQLGAPPEPGAYQVAVGGGRWADEPEQISARPGERIAIRAFRTGSEGPEPAPIGTPLRTTSDWPHRATTTAEHGQVHLLPTSAESGRWPLAVELTVDETTGEAAGPRTVQVDTFVEVVPPSAAPTPELLLLHGLRIDDPAVVGAFDRDGPGLSPIELVLFDHDGSRCVGWGIQRLAPGAHGAPPRALRFAFAGRCSDGTLTLEATTQRVELSALSVSLTRLQLRAHAEDGQWSRGSLLAEWEPRLGGPDLRRALQRPRALLERAGKPFLASRDALRTVASWFPETPTLHDLGQLAGTAARTLPLAPRLLDPTSWRPWSLLDPDRRFLGLGRFEVGARPPTPSGLRLGEIRIDHARARVHATLTTDGEPRSGVVPGVVLVDDHATAPIALDYSRRTRVVRDEHGTPAEVVLELPLDLDAPPITRVIVLADTEVLGRVPLGPGS